MARIQRNRRKARLAKASPEELRRLLGFMATQEQTVRDAFLAFVTDIKSDVVLARVQRYLQQGDVDSVIAIIDAYSQRLGDQLRPIFEAAGIQATAELGRKLGALRTALSFDPNHARAAELMRQNALQFVTDFSETQRTVTRAALAAALDAGEGPRAAAAAFRSSIGLTDNGAAAVQSYRDALEANSADALDRALRDRRMDSAVDAAISNDEPLSGDQIDYMVGSYEDRMIALRADTIARTEMQRVLNEARQEAVNQMIDNTGIDPSTVVRTWRAVQDSRTRDTHREMDGQQVGLDEPFVSPSGAELMYPGDPDAPPEEIINCRCSVIIDFTGEPTPTDEEAAAAAQEEADAAGEATQ